MIASSALAAFMWLSIILVGALGIGVDDWNTGIVLFDSPAGTSLSIDVANYVAIIGDYQKKEAFIYERNDDGLWPALPSNPIKISKETLETFGQAVAITDNCAVISDPRTKQLYIYFREKLDSWEKAVMVETIVTGGTDTFGCSLAISDDYLLVGSMDATVTIYRRFGVKGLEATSQNVVLTAGTSFHTSVAVFGDIAVMGANERAWVYEVSDSSYKWTSKTSAFNPDGNSKNYQTDFPPVAISEEHIIYGDYDTAQVIDFADYSNSLDTESSLTGEIEFETGDNSLRVSRYGNSVDIKNKYLIVGAGAQAYIYKEDADNKFTYGDPQAEMNDAGGSALGVIATLTDAADSAIVAYKGTGKVHAYSRGCPPGQYTSGGGVSCQDCSKGTYSIGGVSQCSKCPQGSYSNKDKAFKCIDCDYGKYNNATGLTGCFNCMAGKYTLSSLTCKDCSLGKYSGIGALACTDCESGKYASTTGLETCDLCPSGKFASERGMSECSICPSGTMASGSGNRRCSDCEPGTYSSADRSTCLPCVNGTFSNSSGAGSCESCGAGTYTNVEGSSFCKICSAGTFSLEKAWNCTVCPAGEYSRRMEGGCSLCLPGTYSSAEAEACISCPRSSYTEISGTGDACMPCPAGRITPGIGSADEDDCLNPASNFVFAVLTIPIALVAALVYLIRGRFKMIAFFRRERVARKLTESNRALSSYIYQYIYDAEARRVYITSYRTLRVVVFYAFGLLISGLMVFVVTLISFAKVLFKAMIVVVSLHADLTFIDKIRRFAVHLAFVLGLPGLHEMLLRPFVDFMEFLVVFKLDFGFVNLTCEGSTSPMKLITALFVMGVVIVIVQSNIALFKTITYDNMSRKFLAAVFSARYRIWDPAIFENLTKEAHKFKIVEPAKFIGSHFVRSAFFSIAAVLISSMQIFQIIPQYLASRVDLGDFIGRNSVMHDFDESCNIIEGFANFDTGIASAASAIAWLLLVPAIYEISNILVPGIPSSMKLNYLELHTTDADYGTYASNVLNVWWGAMSVLAPDLWLADTFQFISKTFCRRTPYNAGLCSPSVAQVERLIGLDDPTLEGHFDYDYAPVQEPKKREEIRSSYFYSRDDEEAGKGKPPSSLFSSFVRTKDNTRKEVLEEPSELFYRLMMPKEGYGTVPFRLFHSSRLVNTSHIWNEVSISDADKRNGCYTLLLIDPANGSTILKKTYRKWSTKDWASVQELSDDLETAPLHCGIVFIKYGAEKKEGTDASMDPDTAEEKALLDSLAKLDLVTFEIDEEEEGIEFGSSDEEEEEEEEEEGKGEEDAGGGEGKGEREDDKGNEEEVEEEQRPYSVMRKSKLLGLDAKTRAKNQVKANFRTESNRALFSLAQNLVLCGGNVTSLANSTAYMMIGSPKVHIDTRYRSFERWVSRGKVVYEQSYLGPTIVTDHRHRTKMMHDVVFSFKAPSGVEVLYVYEDDEGGDGMLVARSPDSGEYRGSEKSETDCPSKKAEASDDDSDSSDSSDSGDDSDENKEEESEKDEDREDSEEDCESVVARLPTPSRRHSTREAVRKSLRMSIRQSTSLVGSPETRSAQLRKSLRMSLRQSLVPTFSGSKTGDPVEITADSETTRWRLHDLTRAARLCFGGDSYLLHSMKRRTDAEKLAWKDYSRRELPSYFTLCVLEVEELHGVHVHVHGGKLNTAYPAWLKKIPAPLLLFLCLLGLGHLPTRSGRRAFYMVLWKYYRFVLLCFGYWTEDVTEYFMVHKTLRNHSLVWEHPEFKLNQAVNGESTSVEFEEDDHLHYSAEQEGDSEGRETGLARGEKNDSSTTQSQEPTFQYYADYCTRSLKNASSPCDFFNWRLHHPTETPELKSLPDEELKMIYANDYGSAVSSMVATRATLLQVVPALAILSVFADLMSSTPLFVQDKRLHLSLPELIAKDSFAKARRMEAEFTGTVNQMRMVDLKNSDDFVDVSEATYRGIGPDKRAELNSFNGKLKEGMDRSLNQPPLLIKEWAVTIKAISYFYYQSRLVQFVVQLYTFVLVIGLLFTEQEDQAWLIYAGLVLFLPKGVIVGLDVLVHVGKILCITDEDLRIFWFSCFGLFGLFKGERGDMDGERDDGEHEGQDEEEEEEGDEDDQRIRRYRRRESTFVDLADVYGISEEEEDRITSGRFTENPMNVS